MPQPKKQAAPVEDIAEEASAPVKGYRPPARWVRATADWQETDEPLSAEIDVSGLTTVTIAWLWSKDLAYSDVWDFIAPRVRNWNALALDDRSRTWQPAPDPCDAGVAALAVVDPSLTIDLMLMVNKAVRGGDARDAEKKG